MARTKRLTILRNVRSTFFWTLGITLLLSYFFFFLSGSFFASSYPRLVIAILTPTIVAVVLKTVFSNLPCRFKKAWITMPLLLLAILFIGQWFVFGTTFSCPVKNYELNEGDRVRLPIFGSYAYFDGKNIKVRRSYFSEEVEIDTSFNDPKAIGISLFGDRITVRFHRFYQGTKIFYNSETGERLGSSSREKGYRHSPLYLIW